MSELTELEAAVATLEAQRGVLGEVAVALAIAPIRARIAALSAATQQEREAERKQATIMFADLSGFTRLSEHVDAEEVRNVVNACFQRLGDVATRAGGYIDKFIGDEIMVLFGAPLALEDHADRALYAALDMRDALDIFNREHPRLRESPLHLHFGVNSGIVVAGLIGTDAKREYTVMGDSVNVAARLVARASAGEILVGVDTRRLAASSFAFEDLGDTALAGREQTHRVYRLTHAEQARRGRQAPMAARSRMLGREREMDQLRAAFETVTSLREPRSVSVIGPAGIGKSRLHDEFRRWMQDHEPQAQILDGAAFRHTTATPYFLFADMIRTYLGINGSSGDVHGQLGAALAALGLTGASTLHALAAVLSIEYEQTTLASLSPQARRDRMFQACAQFLRALAGRGTLVLLFEDLHWADEVSLDLLGFLFATLSDIPILFVSFTRPNGESQAKALAVEAALPEHAHSRLALTELDGDTSSALITSLCPGIEDSAVLLDTVLSKSQGNPFFIEALLGALIDQGIIARDGERYHVAAQFPDLDVPDTVWGVLAERIDRLPPNEKRVIQRSAIVGRTFWEGLVRELADLEPAPELEALRQREFVLPHGPAPFESDREWAFKHLLVQEVAYSGLLRDTRRAGHLRAARWLEARTADRRTEYAPLLAHHFQLGEEWAKAAEYAELAGDRASELFAHTEAAAFFRRVLAACAELPLDDDARRCRIDVALKLAHVSFFTPSEDVLQSLEAAMQLAVELADDVRRLRVMTATASWMYQAGRGREAVAAAMQCIADAGRVGREDMLALPYQIVGRAMYALGEYEKCVEMIERSNALSEANGEELDSTSFGFLSMAYESMGEMEKGRALGLQGLHLAEARRDLRRIASAHLYFGVSPVALGLLQDGREHLEEAVRLAELVGDHSVEWVGLGGLGYWHAQRGELAEATQLLDRALAMAAELGSYLTVPLLQAYRAEVDLRSGRIDDAVRGALAAVELGRDTRQQVFEAQAHRTLGLALCHTAPPRFDEAESELQAAIELHRKAGARALECRARFELAEVLRLRGDAKHARQVAADACAMRDRLGLDWLPTRHPAPPGSDAGRTP